MTKSQDLNPESQSKEAMLCINSFLKVWIYTEMVVVVGMADCCFLLLSLSSF